MSAERRELVLRLAPLDAATAASVLDFCGHLQQAIWRAYGDEIEAHWAATEPEQPIYQRLAPANGEAAGALSTTLSRPVATPSVPRRADHRRRRKGRKGR